MQSSVMALSLMPSITQEVDPAEFENCATAAFELKKKTKKYNKSHRPFANLRVS